MSEDKQLYDIGPAKHINSSDVIGALKKRKKPIIILLILAVIFGGFALALFTGKLNNIGCKISYSKSCAIKDASKYLDASQSQELTKVVEKIKKMDNIKTDADLLYILSVYYINVSDTQNAKTYYEQLSKVYDPKLGYSEKLGTKVMSIREIKESIDFLNKQSKQFESNIRYLKQPK